MTFFSVAMFQFLTKNIAPLEVPCWHMGISYEKISVFFRIVLKELLITPAPYPKNIRKTSFFMRFNSSSAWRSCF